MESLSRELQLFNLIPHCSPTTPDELPHLVWSLPRSLATTRRISFDFFSLGYLDVSVPPVCLINLWIQLMITVITVELPHSGIHGSMLAYQLPVASRRLLRLSSPLSAKASIVCP